MHRPILDRARASLRRLLAERRGNVLMMMGFALIPITFATGMAVDYATAMRLRTKVNSIADTAALSAVTTPMMKNGILTACDTARKMFVSQVTGLDGLTLNTADMSKLTITITESYASLPDATLTCPVITVNLPNPVLPLKRRITVSYEGTSDNRFAGVLGRDTLPVLGTSTATTSLAPYIDIHVALDTSQSMGLAASDVYAKLLWDATKAANGDSHACTFGCHVYAGAESGTLNSYYRVGNDVIAQYVGAKLRVDVLREAMQDMITTAATLEGTDKLYRFAMFRIGQTTTDILALTDNLTTASNAISSLTLGPNDAGGTGDTNLPHFPGYIYPKVTVHGDGTRQSSARAFLFIVTDGVSDIKGSPVGLGCTYDHCTKPIDPATCQQFKDNNVTVGVIYTTYLPVKADPTNAASTALRPEYTDLVKRFSWPGYTSPNPADNSADIGPALERCASPGWYFEASNETTIHAAMQKLFSQASQTPTIIN